MKGVKFDNLHTYDDFSLILSSKKIGVPQPKTELLEVPGSDEMLDFTEFFGDVKYENRKLEFEFTTLVPQSKFMTLFSRIQNALNGKRMKIVLDEDPDFYYSGRVSVKEWLADKSIGKITIECDCDPYKLKKDKTIVSNIVSVEKTVILSNLRKHVVPIFKSSAEIRIEFKGNSYSMSAGEARFPAIVLKEGETELKLKGNSTVTIEYQEGGL